MRFFCALWIQSESFKRRVGWSGAEMTDESDSIVLRGEHSGRVHSTGRAPFVCTNELSCGLAFLIGEKSYDPESLASSQKALFCVIA
jgi:hypothetical protein